MKAIAALQVCLYLDQILGTDGFEQKKYKRDGRRPTPCTCLWRFKRFWLFFALRKMNPLVVSTRDLSTIPTAPTIHLCSHRACEIRSGELWNKLCSPLVCINRTRPRAAQDPRCPRCCAAHSQNTAAAISLPKSSRCRPIPTLTLTAYRARNNEQRSYQVPLTTGQTIFPRIALTSSPTACYY
jgi:hypothetical protein